MIEMAILSLTFQNCMRKLYISYIGKKAVGSNNPTAFFNKNTFWVNPLHVRNDTIP